MLVGVSDGGQTPGMRRRRDEKIPAGERENCREKRGLMTCLCDERGKK